METENREEYTFNEEETVQNTGETEEFYDEIPPRRKKRHTGLIVFLAALILVVAAGLGYYFIAGQQPKKAVETFLGYAQNMDLASMEGMLQSQDLSSLDEADLRTDAYTEFFRSVNSKMTFDITKNDFNVQNGTAQVTAKIRYIDGTNIYTEALSEFVRQIVASAFSGETLTEEETQQSFATILNETAQSAEEQFTEMEVTYPVIKTTDGWKIVALDEGTATFMSANFGSVEDEINASLEELESTEAEPTQGAVPAEGDTIDMSNEKFTIRYSTHKVANDFAGSPCLMLYYDYTNNGDTASSAMVDVSIQAYQNGQSCSAAIPADNDEAVDRFMSEIQPGETATVCQVFSLADNTSDVTLEASEAFNLGGGTVTSQILKLS